MSTITVTFDPPTPADSPSAFNTKAFATLGDLNTWSTQANTVAGEVNTNASTASTAATTATTQAGTATSAASTASSAASSATTSASTATTQASNASSSASAAAISESNAATSAAATAGAIVAERSASRALTNLTGLTVVSGGASITGSSSVTGQLTTTDNVGIGCPTNANYRAIIRGIGTTSATNTLVLENSSGTETVIVDDAGNLLVGTTTGSQHTIQKTLTPNAGNVVLDVLGGTNYAFRAYAIGSFLANAANSALRIGTDGGTGRSINAGGTINASGADYAEYERSNGLTIAKGEIVGFKLDGTLTRTFSEAAARFGVKSTNPGLVGGDTWGSEEIVGKRPEQPVRKADVTETTGEGNEAVTTVIEAGDTDEEWQAKKDAYAAELAVWEAKLEVERQKVDRIAYSGKVPCNVMGATPGGYIIAAEAEDGSIKGEFVASPTFEQYKLAVGRVNRILPDGRCEIAVIIH